MSEKLKQLEQYLDKANALKTAMALIEWDNETLAPKDAGAYTTKVVGTLSQEYFNCITNDQVKKLLADCEKETGLSEIQLGILRELKDEIKELDGIPEDEYRAFAELSSESGRIWAKARQEKDFDSFAPVLKKLVDYQKKFAGYRAEKGQKLYDVMLDHFEKGFSMKELDQFFAKMKAEIVPFLKEIQQNGRPIDDRFLTGNYQKEKQEQLCRYLAEYVGFDFDRGVMAVSAHPFTTNLHNHDVRLTTHYDNNLAHSVFSVIHEAGHGIYELGIPDELTQTMLGQGVSMGMHESQSRFFENILGRNPAFWQPVFAKVKELFPEQLADVDEETFIRGINKVNPGLIRIEADELTYSLHIMIRYELEKQLIEENLEIEKLPQLWADKYEEYLGVRPADAAAGVLQDIHWAQGYFGYFPSYALGSAFGAQMYYHMKKEMDIEGLLAQGDLTTIREYLRQHIHRYGKLKTSKELLKQMTGEAFNADYYVNYLKEKYTWIYFQES